MNVLKKSLLVSATLLLGMQETWTLPPEEEKIQEVGQTPKKHHKIPKNELPQVEKKSITKAKDLYYGDDDISEYVNSFIRQNDNFDYFKNSHYVLSAKKEEFFPIKDQEDGNDYIVAISEAIDTLDTNQEQALLSGGSVASTNIGYFLDKSSHPKEEKEIILEELINFRPVSADNPYGELLQKIEELKRGDRELGFVEDILERQGEIVKNIHAEFREVLDKIKMEKKDVFDELRPFFLQSEFTHAKILFPYNRSQSHWLTGEICIHKKEDQYYKIKIYAHDPYGGGKMEKTNFFNLQKVITKKINEYHLIAPLMSFKNKKSPYINFRQVKEDAISCGVIAAEGLVKRITGPLENSSYTVGALKLRRSHLETVEKNNPQLEFITRNKAKIDFISQNKTQLGDLSSLFSSLQSANKRETDTPKKIYSFSNVNVRKTEETCMYEEQVDDIFSQQEKEALTNKSFGRKRKERPRSSNSNSKDEHLESLYLSKEDETSSKKLEGNSNRKSSQKLKQTRLPFFNHSSKPSGEASEPNTPKHKGLGEGYNSFPPRKKTCTITTIASLNSTLKESNQSDDENATFDISSLIRKKSDGEKSEKLTIALLKSNIQNFEEAYEVSDQSRIDKFYILRDEDKNPQGLIVWERKNFERPSWVVSLEGYLTEVGQANKLRPFTTTEQIKSGLVFIKEQDRVFVFIFGNGRFLLREGVRDLPFGLRSTLNALDVSDPEAVRSFGIDILGLNLISKSESHSKGTSPHKIKGGSFRRVREINVIDKKRDLRIAYSGSNVILRRPLKIDEFPFLCGELLNLSNQTHYKTNFPWADSLVPEEKKTTVDKLDKALLVALKSGQSPNWHLTQLFSEDLITPESEVHAYRLQPNKKFTEYYSLEELAKALDVMGPHLTLSKIKKTLVIEALNSSRELMASSKVYKSLVFDAMLDDHLFVLNGGRWYKVDQQYCEQLSTDINNLFQRDIESLSLPDVLLEEVILKEEGSKRSKTERAYNTRVAANSGGKLLFMDFRLVKGMDLPDPFRLNHFFEICDLLSTRKHLIHVKNGTHANSFSHLLAQGKISALSLERKEMRIKAKDIYVTSEVIIWLKNYYTLLEKTQEFNKKSLVNKLCNIRKKISDSGLARDKILRDKILSKLPNSIDSLAKQELGNKIEEDQRKFEPIISENTFNPTDYTIVYAFFHEGDREHLSDYLPFFSQENLRETEKRLREKGFKVSVIKITKPAKK